MKAFFKFLLGGIATIVLLIAVVLCLLLVRWPTMSKLRNSLGSTLIGHQEMAMALCHNDKAAGIVGASFARDYKPNVPTSVPIADLDFQSPKKAEEKGHGVARVSGLAQSGAYIGGDSTLLPNISCAGIVSFDYRFFWNDNGVSRHWDCEISNLTAVTPPNP